MFGLFKKKEVIPTDFHADIVEKTKVFLSPQIEELETVAISKIGQRLEMDPENWKLEMPISNDIIAYSYAVALIFHGAPINANTDSIRKLTHSIYRDESQIEKTDMILNGLCVSPRSVQELIPEMTVIAAKEVQKNHGLHLLHLVEEYFIKKKMLFSSPEDEDRYRTMERLFPV